MSKKENRSIAYIYDEMDPSEKLEFERDLTEDNNLLIEVESLKKVSDKLNDLREVQPPQELVEAICNHAFQKGNHTKSSYKRSVIYAAAALLLLGMTSGIFFLDQNSTSSNEADPGAASASVGSSTSILSQSIERTSSNTSSSSNSRVTPWVDNNEVIHFHDRFSSGESASIDSIFRSSMQKLTPVTDPSQSKHFQHNFHLTGSRR
jgi:hypothetical protein